MTKTDSPRLVAVPTWDTLFADPSVFDRLPTPAQDAIVEEIAVMEARLRVKVLRRPLLEKAGSSSTERAVRIEEACELLAMTKDFLYRNWPKLGGYRDEDGHVKFPLTALREHINRRTTGDRGLSR